MGKIYLTLQKKINGIDTNVYPYSYTDAVYDENGKSLTKILKSLVSSSEKAAPNGIATLGDDGVIPLNQLPSNIGTDYDNTSSGLKATTLNDAIDELAKQDKTFQNVVNGLEKKDSNLQGTINDLIQQHDVFVTDISVIKNSISGYATTKYVDNKFNDLNMGTKDISSISDGTIKGAIYHLYEMAGDLTNIGKALDTINRKVV